MTWLFATNRERWAKWTTLECYIGTLIIGPLFFLTVYSITGISVVGVLLSLVILGVFTYFFYLSYLTLLESSEKQSD